MANSTVDTATEGISSVDVSAEAVQALRLLSNADKQKVLDYIKSLIDIENADNSTS